MSATDQFTEERVEVDYTTMAAQAKKKCPAFFFNLVMFSFVFTACCCFTIAIIALQTPKQLAARNDQTLDKVDKMLWAHSRFVLDNNRILLDELVQKLGGVQSDILKTLQAMQKTAEDSKEAHLALLNETTSSNKEFSSNLQEQNKHHHNQKDTPTSPSAKDNAPKPPVFDISRLN